MSPSICYLLESLGLREYTGTIFKKCCHYQDEQEGQGYPKSGDLKDFSCDILTQSYLKIYSDRFCIHILPLHVPIVLLHG